MVLNLVYDSVSTVLNLMSVYNLHESLLRDPARLPRAYPSHVHYGAR